MKVERTRGVKLWTVKKGTPYALSKSETWENEELTSTKKWKLYWKSAHTQKKKSTIKHNLNHARLNPQIIKLKQYTMTSQLDELGQ
jgi:hypothetical protein